MSETDIRRYTLDQIRKMKGQTDWERLRHEEAAGVEPAQDDDDFDVDWSKARLVIPETKTPRP